MLGGIKCFKRYVKSWSKQYLWSVQFFPRETLENKTFLLNGFVLFTNLVIVVCIIHYKM